MIDEHIIIKDLCICFHARFFLNIEDFNNNNNIFTYCN